MSEHSLLPGRPYAAQIHTKTTNVTITHIKHRLDIDTGAHLAAKTLGLNEIATVNVSFDRFVPFTPYVENKRLGAFIVIDKLTQRDGRCGSNSFCPTSISECPLARARDNQNRPHGDEASAAALSMVYWAFRFG